MSLVVAALLGVGLGVVTGMPLGVINVAIVDAASTGRVRFATGIGIGGGLADTVHAGLAFAGTGALVTSQPQLVRGLAIGAAVLIVGYAISAWRREPEERTTDESKLVRGIATGVVLTLPNPAALAAWVGVAAALWPTASVAEASVLGGGVGLGSAVWFAMLARWASRIPRGHRALKIMRRAALIFLVGIAAYGVLRVV